MSEQQIAHTAEKSVQIAIAWCLAWGGDQVPQYPDVIQEMREALKGDRTLPDSAQPFLAQAKQLDELEFPETGFALKELTKKHKDLWNAKIGLVYGGATKIKQYVFEAAKLQDIRGASALLGRINLIDLPAFFHCEEDAENYPQCANSEKYCQENVREQWLDIEFPNLSSALIPELIIYSKGGNILAFCPAAFVDQLANAIEKRYTHETLTANSCAVGATFRPLEIRFGLLQDPIEHTCWLDKLNSDWKTNPLLGAYFGLPQSGDRLSFKDLRNIFKSRKNFNELVSKLATQFNLRRSGYDPNSRRPNYLSCRYPPMLETHPYLRRDNSDRSSAVTQITELPSYPWVSEPLARKRRLGEVTKQESALERGWYGRIDSDWQIQAPESWVQKFEQYLIRQELVERYDPEHRIFDNHQKIKNIREREARSLKEISDASSGFVAYIYADGNNMGQYIRDHIKTPPDYQRFSGDIFDATEQSVYEALAEHLAPHPYTPDAQSNRTNKDEVWIHPFEIITIGGDDVLLIVPANKALVIAKVIGEKFEEILVNKGKYSLADAAKTATHQSKNNSSTGDRIHRYKPAAPSSKCCLSISSGVLITAVDTPIYYADKLVSQLLKSAKKRAKELRDKYFYGGTVDFLTLKAITMISSNIEAFRKEGLTINRPQQQLKLYAAPYTLHELDGLLKTAQALKKSKFPRSQLYQIRSLLERGKRTAILNYRYFRVRLKKEQQALLLQDFESVWCDAETNNGNLAPWLTAKKEADKTIYETIWRELVELAPFTDEPLESDPPDSAEGVVQEGAIQ
jgi:CRISPR-associated protein Cmr2